MENIIIKNKRPLIDLSTRESRMGLLYFAVMFLFHVLALSAFFIEFNRTLLFIFLFAYVTKILGVTMGFHRYFAHKSFKTNRFFQFILGFVGTSAIQGGVLWWASHHRGHHQHSDEEDDLHSPITHSTFHSHLGWMWSKDCFMPTKHKLLDFARFPEIKFLNKHYFLLIVLQGLAYYLLGEFLHTHSPALAVDGFSAYIWGFIVSTVFVWHITFCINSVCHLFGSKRYDSKDESRNNWLMAILTFGEGWHNNHHKYGWSARNGFFWWEWDPTYYALKVLEIFGIVWDLKVPNDEQLNATIEQSN